MSDFYLELEEIQGLSDQELESALWDVLPDSDECDPDLGELFAQADKISDHRTEQEISEMVRQWQDLQLELAEMIGYEDLE